MADDAQIEIRAAGTHSVPSADGPSSWCRLKSGILTATADNINFLDWSIPVAEISDVVLRTDRVLNTQKQFLTFAHGKTRYSFTLKKRIEPGYSFPFAVNRISKQTLPGKIIIGAALLFFVNMLMLLVGVWLSN